MKKLEPYPIQQSIIDSMVQSIQRHKVALNVSGTGTGKTLMTVVACKKLGLRPIVIAPVATLTAWERTFDQQEVDYYDVVGLEKLRSGKLPYYNKTKWTVSPDTVVVVDECHRCKNASTLSGKLLIQAKLQNIPLILLSATPFHSPVEMSTYSYVLDFIPTPTLFYKWAQANGCHYNHFNALVFDNRQKKVLTQINDTLHQKGMMSKISREQVAEYFQETQVMPYLLDSTPKITKELKHLQQLLASIKHDNKILVEIIKSRKIVELGKVAPLQELIQDRLEEGLSPVVFLNFTESIDQLSRGLTNQKIPHGILDGRTKDKAKVIDDFQDDKTFVIIVQLQAGGAGISLHDVKGNRPRVSYISPSYSLVDNLQALGRIDRAGAKSNNLQYILTVAGTIEERIALAIQRKETNLNTIIK